MFSNPLTTLLLTAATLATSTHAATDQTALVTITSSHGGAGDDLTNTTVTIPLSTTYTNTSALSSVSYLYLTGSTGVNSIDSITCTPFKFSNATGLEGYSFNSSVPSLLSTNTVDLGSIVCTTNEIMAHPPVASLSSSSTGSGSGPGSGTTRTATAAGGSGGTTATTLTNAFASSAPATRHTTITSGIAGGVSSGSTSGSPSSSSATTATTTSVPMASQTGTSGGQMVLFSSELFGGLAVAGLGLAFVL